ncbi:metallophosphoesterase family protein [Brevundimonas sp. BR2-1]|uniref:metallophosphoesterase family protein n=1 Tax=Brevundimonas sp. BR2-1 TaxID=3031123 RepID=UPI0030B6E69E
MISKFLNRRTKVQAPQNPAVPDGVIAWAIGDIHGRLDLLRPLIDGILSDAAASRASRKVVVFLGDYIDRGPQSREVIQYLCALPAVAGIEWRFLKGNHEETMLNFLDDPSEGIAWCEYGGDATLRSFSLRPPELKHKQEAWAHVSADLNHKLSAAERNFLDALELTVVLGDYFFVHAGARPGEALDRQSARDLMWIRTSFLNSDVEFDKVIVHGHTPSAELHVDRRRIGVDTRAYESGVLSAVRLEGDLQVAIQTVEGAEGPALRRFDLARAEARGG